MNIGLTIYITPGMHKEGGSFYYLINFLGRVLDFMLFQCLKINLTENCFSLFINVHSYCITDNILIVKIWKRKSNKPEYELSAL